MPKFKCLNRIVALTRMYCIAYEVMLTVFKQNKLNSYRPFVTNLISINKVFAVFFAICIDSCLCMSTIHRSYPLLMRVCIRIGIPTLPDYEDNNEI